MRRMTFRRESFWAFPFKSLLLALILTVGVASWATAQMGKDTFCPVMPDTPAKEKFYVDYHGRRIYLCCRACVKAFKKHPEKYLKDI